jgi:membrane fusion protein (multidrug efflux system)
MVPEQAIVPGGQPAVFKVVDGKATLVKVRLGVRRAAQVEVVAGLADGDLVVTAGQLKLREGVPVRAIGEGAPAAPAAGTAAGQ